MCLLLQAPLFGLMTPAKSFAQNANRGQGSLRVQVINPSISSAENKAALTGKLDLDICDQPVGGVLSGKVDEGFLENAIVWLEPEDESLKKKMARDYTDETSLRIEVRDCRLSESFYFIGKNQKLEISSADRINYDLRFVGLNSIDRVRSLPPNLSSIEIRFSDADIYRVLGVLHPQIEAVLVVKEHDLYSSTNKRGVAVIDKFPEGRYYLHLWHPILGGWKRPEPVDLFARANNLEVLWPDEKKNDLR